MAAVPFLLNMKQSFLVHLVVTLCGVVCCDAELIDAQNSIGPDAGNIHNSKHNGDKKSVFDDSSFGKVYDKHNQKLSNETAPYASEIGTAHSQSVNAEGTVVFLSDDDSTIATSENPVEETTTDLPDTSQTIDGSITDETNTVTDEQTTTDENTTLDPDKGNF